MRILTIKRVKSFVGCLAKMKIYIEDPSANDLVINDVSCRKLGVLKNGEEKTFEIGEEQARVFVIADKLSKNYCNEFYRIPSGQDNVFLSGKNRFNPANGNAFRFDNNESTEVLEGRKKGIKKGLLVLCAAIVLGAAVGYAASSSLFSDPKVESKVFSENGMSITLTNEFRRTEMENYTNCYDSAEVAVVALKEEFSLVDGFENYTLEEYGNLVLQNNGLYSSELKTIDGRTYFEYEFTNPDTKDTYKFYSFVYKADDAFWLVQFATRTENVEKLDSKIIEWANTVSFE